MTGEAPEVLWEPGADTVARAQINAFTDRVRRYRGVAADSYEQLWSWSTRDLEGFWGAVADFCGVRFHDAPSRVLGSDDGRRRGVTLFGTSASFVQSCLDVGRRPGADHDLSALQAIGSTGSPLSSEGFDWIHDCVGAGLQMASVSGGTDV